MHFSVWSSSPLVFLHQTCGQMYSGNGAMRTQFASSRGKVFFSSCFGIQELIWFSTQPDVAPIPAASEFYLQLSYIGNIDIVLSSSSRLMGNILRNGSSTSLRVAISRHIPNCTLPSLSQQLYTHLHPTPALSYFSFCRHVSSHSKTRSLH